MAAGYDKNAEVPDALLRLGFGFAEVGTVTPLPQAGNPKPRIFRLTEDEAVINRLGFNNEGHDGGRARGLRRAAGRAGIVGVNIGANKDSADRIARLRARRRSASRRSPPISRSTSPRPTRPACATCRRATSLAELLARVIAARDAACRDAGRKRADLPEDRAGPRRGRARRHRRRGDGARDRRADRLQHDARAAGAAVTARMRRETGGLSGRPLFERSTIVLARMRRLLGPDIAHHRRRRRRSAPRRRWRRSAPAPTWCSSTPA